MLKILLSTSLDFILTVTDASSFVNYGSKIENYNFFQNKTMSMSKVLGYTSESHIAYRKFRGNDHGIAHYYQFSSNDVLLQLAILTMAIFTIIRTKRYRLIHYYYSLYSVVLKQSLSRVLRDKATSNRIMMIVWLYACLMIGINFSNNVLEQKVMTLPDKVIDSWQDLFENKHVEIAVIEQDTLVKFATDSENEMARDFKSRLRVWEHDDWCGDDILLQLAINMSTGQTAMIKSKTALKFMLLHMSQILLKKFKTNFMKNMHISKHGAWNLPYFIPSNKENHHPYVRHLNEM